MKEFKVMRGRRRITRYRRRRGGADFRPFLLGLATLCGIAVIGTALFFGIKYLINYTPSVTPAEIEPCVVEDGQTSSLDMASGEIRMITVSAGSRVQDSLEFESDNTEVLTVDSGGRVDALKEGTATVSVEGTRFSGKCSITVTKAKEEPKATEYTTAIIANLDIVEKNKKNKNKNLYKVTVNRRTNTVTVYTYDENGDYVVPVRAMICSCGEFTDENITPEGTYAVYFKKPWHPLFDDVYGQYVTGFSGPYLFHSVPYAKASADTLKSEEFNKLGTNASQGCVRLMTADARWIYKNLKMDTVVEVIDKTASSDPLGTPEKITVTEAIKWDPTDPNKRNPYKTKMPTIDGVWDVTIEEGSKYECKVTAVDSCWQDITDKVRVTGNVITTKKGKYLMTYSVTDNLGKTAEKTVTVTVE